MERDGQFEGVPARKVNMDDSGVIELVYTWRHASGHRVECTKTVYDPKLISDQQFAENVKTAIEKAIDQGVENGDNEVRVGKIIYNVQVRQNTVKTVFPIFSWQAIEELR